MPYDIGSGNNILPGILSVMAAIKQGKIAKQERDQNQQYLQAQIQNMQAEQKRTASQDTIQNRQNGVGLQIPANLQPPTNADPMTMAKANLAIANWLDSQGATTLAKSYREDAAQTMLANYRNAQTNYTQAGVPLRGAQTNATQALVPLRGAQTQYTKAGVPLRQAQTKRITTIQPQQFQEQQQNQMQRAQAALAAAQQRAAEAQAAAFERLSQRLQFDQQQQQRSFQHSDRSRANTASGHKDNSQAELLRSKVRAILKANPGASTDAIRAAARSDGYPESVINLVLPVGPSEAKAAKNFKKTTSKGTSFGWGTP